MFDIVFLKTAHVISSTILFGTGLGTAFHGLASNLRGDLHAVVAGNRNVVLADWLFTTPAVIVQPVTGVLLAMEQGCRARRPISFMGSSPEIAIAGSVASRSAPLLIRLSVTASRCRPRNGAFTRARFVDHKTPDARSTRLGAAVLEGWFAGFAGSLQAFR